MDSPFSPNVSGGSWVVQVLVRGRVHTVRGKGKTAFLVIRQRTATVQAVMFVDDATVSRGMVKYASGISRESVVDVAGTLAVPASPVTSCTQSQARGPWRRLLSVTCCRHMSAAGRSCPTAQLMHATQQHSACAAC